MDWQCEKHHLCTHFIFEWRAYLTHYLKLLCQVCIIKFKHVEIIAIWSSFSSLQLGSTCPDKYYACVIVRVRQTQDRPQIALTSHEFYSKVWNHIINFNVPHLLLDTFMAYLAIYEKHQKIRISAICQNIVSCR